MSDTTKNSTDDVSFESSKIYIKRSKLNGKGVYAKVDIVSGDLIEKFPLFPTQFRTRYQADPAILMNSFIKHCTCQECTKHGSVIYLGFGYSCMYDFKRNYECNATYSLDYDHFYGNVMATKNITKNTEISIDISESHYYTQAIAKAMEQENNENRSEY
jgi:hypothetical protein